MIMSMSYMRWLSILIFMMVFITGCASDDEFSSLSTEGVPSTQERTASPSPSLTNTATPTRTAPPPSPTMTLPPLPTSTPVYFSGAGDVSICGQTGDDQTAAILMNQVGHGLFFVAGDSSNENGNMYEYQNCFSPSWGNLLPNLRVVPGNHDYYSNPVENYWIYFDGVAGEPGKGWYSFEHGDWHIVMLNSNCGYVGCGPSSEQIAWLKQDLENTSSDCSLAIWHHPRFNSGIAGNADWLYTFWDVLYEQGVDVIVNGHDHHYERMAKINPKGEIDPNLGIRSFVVGTGGASFYAIDQVQPFSEIRITNQFGIIQFTLNPASYTWQFINVNGEIMDQGEDTCSPAFQKSN